jgi:hypothetical protein
MRDQYVILFLLSSAISVLSFANFNIFDIYHNNLVFSLPDFIKSGPCSVFVIHFKSSSLKMSYVIFGSSNVYRNFERARTEVLLSENNLNINKNTRRYDLLRFFFPFFALNCTLVHKSTDSCY